MVKGDVEEEEGRETELTAADTLERTEEKKEEVGGEAAGRGWGAVRGEEEAEGGLGEEETEGIAISGCGTVLCERL